MSDLPTQIYHQPATDDEHIIDSLRPIFPQFGEAAFRESIGNARRTFVGADPHEILTEAINFLLAETHHERHEEQNNQVQGRHARFALNHEDDIVYVRTSNTNPNKPILLDYYVPEHRNAKNDVFTNTNDCVEILPGNETFVRTTTANAYCVDQHEQAQLPIDPDDPSVTQPANGLDAIADEELQPVDPAEEAFQHLRGMFTTAEEEYLRNLLRQWPESPYEVLVNNACNHLLENSNYPKKETALRKPTTSKDDTAHNYLTDYSVPVTPLYQVQCLEVLSHDFRMIRMKDIRAYYKQFNCHYSPCKKALEEVLTNALNQAQKTVNGAPLSSSYSSTSVTPEPKAMCKPLSGFQLLKCGRSPRKMPTDLVPELQSEVDFMKKLNIERTAEQDRQIALMLNEQQYQEEGQEIECGCCFGTTAFDQMVQCMDGHLFCGDCIKAYAKEAAFGEGKASLTCMTDGCDSTFPVSQLHQCLPANVLAKYEDRVQEESLSLAQMEDLVKCPGCDYAVIMPPGDKVFKCQDPLCAKEICRYCKEDWSEHFGLPCSEVEKSSEKNVRLSYEERMTLAKIRKCAKCGCEFTKSTGCNKMTCRCGTTQCYVCRKSNITYSHFCTHPRDPGQRCKKCACCSLWTDPTQDDDRAVKELETEALEAKRKLDATAPESAAKKLRVEQVQT